MSENDEMLIAYCGLYCGSCGAYKKNKCPGCSKNEKATWCAVRTCCISGSTVNCSSCKEFDDLRKCKKLNNFISKIFGLIFNSDRIKTLQRVRELGPSEYAKYMSENDLQHLKRS